MKLKKIKKTKLAKFFKFYVKRIKKYFKQQTKLENYLFFISCITVFISFFTYVYIYQNFDNYYNQILKADSLVHLEDFNNAESTYKSISTISDSQKQVLQDRLNNLTVQKQNNYYFYNASNLINQYDYKDAINDLKKVTLLSQDYAEAQIDINDLNNIEEKKIELKSEYDNYLTEGEKQKKSDDLDKALDNYTKAYQLASSEKLLMIDTASINDIRENIVEIKAGIQQRKDEILKRSQEYSLRVPILMYHYIRVNPIETDTLGFSLSVTPNDFDSQMKYLADNGYTTLSVNDLINALNSKSALPTKPIIITFDDGYEDYYTDAFPILKKYNLKSEIYIISGFVGKSNYMTWDMLTDIKNSGMVEIGSHTIDHPALTQQNINDVKKELTESKSTLEANLGIKITDFCYPYGNFNYSVEREVANAGYLNATTTQAGLLHFSGDNLIIPRVRVSGGESLQSFISGL